MFGSPSNNVKGYAVSSLKEIAVGSLSYGSTSSAVDYDGTTRYVRITDIADDGSLNDDVKSATKTEDKYLLSEGDILFARTGATVGKTCLYKEKYGRSIYAGFLIRLIPDIDKVLPEYVFNFTKSEYYLDFVKSTQRVVAQPNINAQEYGDLEILVPPIDEQQKFVEFVNQSDKSKFIMFKSQFIEMFGDYRTNSKGWPIAEFKEFAKIDANMTTDFESYAEYPHIGIDSIEKDTGVISGYRTVKEDNVISGKYVFTQKHIIYSKIRPNLNKVALPEFEGLCSADAYPILPNDENCNRIYLAVLLRSEYFLTYILGFSARSNMPKVNRKQVEGFKTPLPPVALQEQFAEFYKQSDKSK